MLLVEGSVDIDGCADKEGIYEGLVDKEGFVDSDGL